MSFPVTVVTHRLQITSIGGFWDNSLPSTVKTETTLVNENSAIILHLKQYYLIWCRRFLVRWFGRRFMLCDLENQIDKTTAIFVRRSYFRYKNGRVAELWSTETELFLQTSQRNIGRPIPSLDLCHHANPFKLGDSLWWPDDIFDMHCEATTHIEMHWSI